MRKRERERGQTDRHLYRDRERDIIYLGFTVIANCRTDEKKITYRNGLI